MMNATQEIRASQEHMQEIFRTNQEKMDAWIAYRKNDRKESTACHDEMEASIKKIKPNSGEKEAVVELQEISNEEVAIHSLSACRSKTAASQEAMEADTEKIEPDSGMMQSVA
jgi:aspartyl-tRNA synthetase